MTVLLLMQIDHPHTGYYSNVVIVVLLGVCIGYRLHAVDGGYTEAVEAHNPALAASGLAVWGWVLRIVVAASFVALPMVITTSTTLVDNEGAATDLQALQAAQPYVPAADNLHPKAAPASVIASLEQMTPAGPGPGPGRPAGQVRPDPRHHGGHGRGARRPRSSRSRGCWPSPRWPPTSRRAAT